MKEELKYKGKDFIVSSIQSPACHNVGAFFTDESEYDATSGNVQQALEAGLIIEDLGANPQSDWDKFVDIMYVPFVFILLLSFLTLIVRYFYKRKKKRIKRERNLDKIETLSLYELNDILNRLDRDINVRTGAKIIGKSEEKIKPRTKIVDKEDSAIINSISVDDKVHKKEIKSYVKDVEIPIRQNESLVNVKNKIEIECERDIIPSQEIIYTSYSLPTCKCNSSYSYYTAPKKNTIVFPYRRCKTNRRGYTEIPFEHKLRESLKEKKNYMVLGDVSILVSEKNQPYEPDIAIVECKYKYGIRVDIEIDEPYSGLDRTPIHYMNCGDTFRDRNLSNIGWIVIRFSEKQIYLEANKCINYIKYILSCIDSSIQLDEIFPTPDKCWTKLEAELMAANLYREKYLNHTFRSVEGGGNVVLFAQTELEKEVASKVIPLDILPCQQNNIDKSSLRFTRDECIAFEPSEHIYIYKGLTQLMPVSEVVQLFFVQFDILLNAERVANREGRNIGSVIEQWAIKGERAKKVGTYLHSLIQSYWLGDDLNYNYKFDYQGYFCKCNEIISLKKEFAYFKQFLLDSAIIPFRSEWTIFDEELGIAGTVDLISRNGDEFDLYDWKRSEKAFPTERIFKYGINGLENVPDIAYYHYAIQLNLYRYILEKKYGVLIRNMYIVVLHSTYRKYHKFQISRMDEEIKKVVKYLRNSYIKK
jgi:hypothetical protein